MASPLAFPVLGAVGSKAKILVVHSAWSRGQGIGIPKCFLLHISFPHQFPHAELFPCSPAPCLKATSSHLGLPVPGLRTPLDLPHFLGCK